MPENVIEKVAEMSQNDPKMTPKGCQQVVENTRKSKKIEENRIPVAKNHRKSGKTECQKASKNHVGKNHRSECLQHVPLRALGGKVANGSFRFL